MNKVKKPKWDKPIHPGSAGTYGNGTIIPPNSYIDAGMTAYAKHQSVEVVIKINKAINKHDTEGTIIKINSATETVGDLAIGDHVFINRWDVECLIQDQT